MIFRYDIYHKLTIVALNFTLILCLVLLKPVKTALQLKGRFPVMAEITRKLAANTRTHIFFVIITAASSRCLVEKFKLICYSKRVNARWQYVDGGSSSFSKWPKDRLVTVVKPCWLLVQRAQGGYLRHWYTGVCV